MLSRSLVHIGTSLHAAPRSVPVARVDPPRAVVPGVWRGACQTCPHGLRTDDVRHRPRLGSRRERQVADRFDARGCGGRQQGDDLHECQHGHLRVQPEGKLVRRFVGPDYTSLHDIEIHNEEADEFIFGARNAAGEGIKIHAETGDIALRLPFPKESGLDLKKFSPTAITVAPNGNIILSDGYASDHIFIFDAKGKYLKHFGAKGNDLKQFNTAHGMTLDTRYEPARLLICDRNHAPKGRLLHYTLDGEFIEEVVTGLGMPTSASVQGDFVSVPDLHGRLVILDKSNTIMAVLGHNPTRPPA